MAFSIATLTHTFQNPDGSPATGTLQFTLTKGMNNGGTTILPLSLSSALVNGVLTQQLTANKDAGTDPPDSQWRVDIRLDGMDPLTYFIVVPSGGGTIDLGTLLPSEGASVPMDITTQWQTYLDLTWDVKPYLGQAIGNTNYSQTALQDIADMACTWVQQYIQKPVPPTTFHRVFDGYSGWMGTYIELPFYPVLQIVSLTEYFGSASHQLVEQTPGNTGSVGQYMYQLDRQTGQIRRTFAGNYIEQPWFPGSRNIDITWIAGYNPIPKDIRQATLELIEYWFRNTQEATRAARVGAGYEEMGAGTFAYAVPNRVTELLQLYRPLLIG